MRKSPAVAAAVLAVGVLGGGAAAAAPAADHTRPTLTVPRAASFVVGKAIGDSTGPDGASPQTYPIAQRVSWQASDASGICGYKISEVYAGSPPEVVADTRRTTFSRATTDYDDQQGGGSFKVESWRITARDCAGNTTSRQTLVTPVVTQEDGWTYGYPGVTIAYRGSWAVARCSCFSGDQAEYTSAPGALALISRTWSAGAHVALVVEKAPNRGQFTVSVDGVPRATIDSYAAAPTHRMVVWESVMPVGKHTVQLKNLATPGRPRIDLDAVLSNPYN
ncbi:MAG: hypothetical protein ABI661_13020 [Gammaproteobacteria bacterium]